MLREYWYIVAEGREVTQRTPVGRRLLGQDVVVWRDRADQVHVLRDQCIHRGVPLSQGRVDGDCIRCPFHGWAYSGDGRCVLIPSNGAHAPTPPNARTYSYPVHEAGGYVWAYTGQEIPAPTDGLGLPPELVETGWVAGRRHDDVAANYTRVVEQSIDIAHIPWVHRRTIGRGLDEDARLERPMECYSDGLTIYFDGRMPDWLEVLHQGPNQRTASAHHRDLQNGTYFKMPNIFRVVQGGMVMGLIPVPIDEGHSRIYQYVARRWGRWPSLWASLVSIFTLYVNHCIVREDNRILGMQIPKRMPEDIREEFQVRTDAAEMHYRRLRAEYFASHPQERGIPAADTQDRGSWQVIRSQSARGCASVAIKRE